MIYKQNLQNQKYCTTAAAFKFNQKYEIIYQAFLSLGGKTGHIIVQRTFRNIKGSLQEMRPRQTYPPPISIHNLETKKIRIKDFLVNIYRGKCCRNEKNDDLRTFSEQKVCGICAKFLRSAAQIPK